MKETKPTSFLKIASSIKDADIIYEIGQGLLFTPKMYSLSTEIERKEKENVGFVIGYHDKTVVQQWIGNSKNKIIIQYSESDFLKENAIGYVLLLGEADIIKEVQGYAQDVNFINVKFRDSIKSGHFVYLMQIGISKFYQNKGFGSELMQYITKNTVVPIISFVIKSPLQNYPSLYTHIKNGFQYMGDYTGNYDEFEEYRSVGLIYYPNIQLPSKDSVRKLFEKCQI
ncbi:MAG: GNAT family N-acetyltransferase [Promethearchaeota archaeon]